MWIDRAVKWLLPREDKFFELLERGAGLVRDVGGLLDDCCAADADDREVMVARMHQVEHDSDAVIAEMYEALNRTFVTPMDRSDIFQLGTALESLVDDVFATALQLQVHAMDDLPPGSEELTALIRRACAAVEIAVGDLRGLKDPTRIREQCDLLDRLESEGDRIFRTNLAEMFRTEPDAIRLIKHKEFLEGLEETLDACDHVGNALRTIVIKNA